MSELSPKDLAFNLKYIDALNERSKAEVVASCVEALESFAEVAEAIDSVSLEGAYTLPWSINCGTDQNDEAEDAKVLSNDGERIVCTDSGWYPPNCANSKIIVQCVNAIWNIKSKIKARKER